MSYSVSMRSSSFRISKEKFGEALKAIRAFFEEPAHDEYVELSNIIGCCDAGDIINALANARWYCGQDSKGICSIKFIGSKLGVDDQLFCILAPFVEDGSFIEMEGEEKNLWRWKFENGTCIDEQGRVLYESDPLYTVVCDWISDCESGLDVLCITPDISEARRVLQENIKIEKTNSWISDVEEEDIGTDDDCDYCEEMDEDSWSFYKNGSYLEAHTAIKIIEKDKEN